MSVFPCHWTIVSLLKTHCYLPFSTICPSLQAHGSIKWTGLETMLRMRWFDATWLCHLKWPPKHREQLHHTEGIHKSSFHKAVKITSSSGCGRVAAAVVDAPDLKRRVQSYATSARSGEGHRAAIDAEGCFACSVNRWMSSDAATQTLKWRELNLVLFLADLLWHCRWHSSNL